MVSSVVVLPAPFGPSSATTSPAPDREAEIAHDGRAAVAGGEPLHVDERGLDHACVSPSAWT